MVALRSPEFVSQVPMNKRELLLERAKKAQLPVGPGYVTFQDFVNVVSASKSNNQVPLAVVIAVPVPVAVTAARISLSLVPHETNNGI